MPDPSSDPPPFVFAQLGNTVSVTVNIRDFHGRALSSDRTGDRHPPLDESPHSSEPDKQQQDSNQSPAARTNGEQEFHDLAQGQTAAEQTAKHRPKKAQYK